jgi:hypothetical protein
MLCIKVGVFFIVDLLNHLIQAGNVEERGELF